MRRARRLSYAPFRVLVLSALGTPALSLAADVPPWISEAAASPMPGFAPDVAAYVLLAERTVTVESDGVVTTRDRRVVRCLNESGRGYARASVTYAPDSAKVRSMKGWLLRSNGGETRRYDRKDIIDVAAAPEDVYNEARVAVLSAADEATPGAVFGAEWVVEDRPLFTQFDWEFQGRLPARRSSVTLELPAGWTATSVTFNHAEVGASTAERTRTWEMKDLPPLPEEPLGPPVTSLAPRLAVSYEPSIGGAGSARPLKTWGDVSRWMWKLAEPQSQADGAMQTKARETTMGATGSREKAERLGQLAQRLRYISVQTGIGRGGGYKPHAASDVLARGYGDCKDKANLLRALLGIVGIRAHVVSVYSGDRSYVREEWPSPQQFNHAIVAIELPAGENAPAVLDHPTLGRMLFFDPTDPDTPFGELPEPEQGSLALLSLRPSEKSDDPSPLVRLPRSAAEVNQYSSLVTASLTTSGAISGTLLEKGSGDSAAGLRSEARILSRPEYTRRMAAWLQSSVPGVQVSNAETAGAGNDAIAATVTFSSPHYAQSSGDLLLFRPAVAPWRSLPNLTAPTRTQPMLFSSRTRIAESRITLPEGWTVDELPDAVSLKTAWGAFSMRTATRERVVTLVRELRVSAEVPASEYEVARSFFEAVRRSGEAPVVLKHK